LPSQSSRKPKNEESKSGEKKKKLLQQPKESNKLGTNSDFKSGKTSQKRKDIDDMNKSIDSIDDLQVFDSAEESSKVPILCSLKQIKG